MVWIPFWAAGVINGVGHYWGYRNFETHDASRNIVPFGILIGGEELHNNHHAYGSSARLSNKWWEFDVGWLYIRLLEIAGVGLGPANGAEERPSRRRPARRRHGHVARGRHNRFHVLKLYGTRVVRPVLAAEARYLSSEGRRRLRRVRHLISKEKAVLEGRNERHLSEALQTTSTVQTIYEFRQRLKGLWTQQAKGQHELLARSAGWCADAEQSGIAALEDFARQLRAYRARFA